jgi:hypothetical protein
MEQKSEEIKEVYYKIEFKGEVKILKYEDLVKLIKLDKEAPKKVEEPVKDAKKDSKKDNKKGGKNEPVEEKPKEPEIKEEVEFN